MKGVVKGVVKTSRTLLRAMLALALALTLSLAYAGFASALPLEPAAETLSASPGAKNALQAAVELAPSRIEVAPAPLVGRLPPLGWAPLAFATRSHGLAFERAMARAGQDDTAARSFRLWRRFSRMACGEPPWPRRLL